MKLKLSMLTTMLAALGAEAQSGGYVNTCDSCRIDNFGQDQLLICSCGDGAGRWVGAQINLNNCFGNAGGYVHYQIDGGFAYSCSNINLDYPSQSVMVATCGNGQGGWGTNHIDLNDYIGNTGGDLVC